MSGPAGILFRRILPNSLTPMIVAGTLGIAGAVLDVAALSFLGLGAQPPLAEWGSMIGQDSGKLFTAPHLIVFPGIALTLTVFGFNLLGDGLRDAPTPAQSMTDCRGPFVSGRRRSRQTIEELVLAAAVRRGAAPSRS